MSVFAFVGWNNRVIDLLRVLRVCCLFAHCHFWLSRLWLYSSPWYWLIQTDIFVIRTMERNFNGCSVVIALVGNDWKLDELWYFAFEWRLQSCLSLSRSRCQQSTGGTTQVPHKYLLLSLYGLLLILKYEKWIAATWYWRKWKRKSRGS